MNRLLVSFILGFALPLHAATLTVTTTTDELNVDGDCSLREAVQAANSNTAVDACAAGSGDDEILIPSGTYVLNRAGAGEDSNATGDLDVTGNLTLSRSGSGVVTLDGNATDRILQVLGSARVAVNDVTFTNGRLPDSTAGTGAAGGAVHSAGTVSFTRCTFTNNGAGKGLDSSSFPSTGGAGGAIAATGAVSLSRCTFTDNRGGAGGNLSGGGGGSSFPGQGGAGGAVWSNGGTLTVDQCTFINNRGGAGGTGGFFGGSGGLGGAIFSAMSAAVVTDSTFIGNSGGTSSSFTNHGGGIAKLQGMLVVKSSTFNNNTGQLGGGVFASGASLTVVNSTFFANVSTLRGGGIALESGTTTVNSSTLVGNRGGGVAIQGGGTVVLRGNINAGNRNVADSDFYDCEQTGGTLSSGGSNIFGNGTNCPPIATDQSVAGASVATTVVSNMLASNGGPTQTLLPVAGGLAIDRGSCTEENGTPILADQRGVPRAGTRCDVGSVEANVTAPVVVRITAEPAGMACATGGTRVQTGEDDGSGGGTALDGVLQNGEVDQTQYACNGADGVGALVSATTLMAGDASCAQGGTRVDVGRDDDRDGTLDMLEIDATSYACNGATGPQGPAGPTGLATLLKLTVLAAGDAQCPAGGSRVEMGVDDDRSGTLEAGEVDATTSICDGRPGAASLVKVTSLGTGDSHCANGGAQLDTGVDDDGSGSLSAAEIDSTAYVCNGATGEQGPKGGCASAPGGLLIAAALAALLRGLRFAPVRRR